MQISINNIELESGKDSIIHRIDGRIKFLISLFIIIYAVYTTDLYILCIMEIYLLILILVSKISLTYTLKRMLLIIPFGGAIALFQLFIQPGTVLYSLPFGLTITYEGLNLGMLLFSRLIVCITAIVFLSSVTPVQEIIISMRRLGIPKEFSMLLSLMIRYIFLFYDELKRMRNAQKARCFNIWNKKTSYMWRIHQGGNSILTLFLRSYEQGEKAYLSMLSRGYSMDSHIYLEENRLVRGDFFLITITIGLVVGLEIIRYFSLI